MSNGEVVRSYLRAFSSADVDAVAAHVTEDFVNRQPGELGQSCQGAAVYRQRLASFLSEFCNLRYAIEELVVQGDRVAVAYHMTCTYQGHPIAIPGAMLITLRDGLIAARTDYWDGLSFLKQTEPDA